MNTQSVGVSFALWGLSLFLAPLLPAIISRTKALFAGRHGVPFFQWYYEIFKLFRKGAVYSNTTSPVFKAGPAISLATVLGAGLLIPFGGVPSVVSFEGDLFLLIGLLALGRFVTILAALDTGSPFEGMGAEREAWFAVLAEPVFLIAFLTLGRGTGTFSISDILLSVEPGLWNSLALPFTLCSGAFLAVCLTENSRIPIDDPTTHLELTMIHEVMVLDHSGPDFGLITYGGALKLWVYGMILTGLIPLKPEDPWTAAAFFLLFQAGIGVLIGVIESVTARLRLPKVSGFLTAAFVFAALAFFLSLR